MKVKRMIGAYDNNTEELLFDLNIDNIPFEELIKIFKAYKGDPSLFYLYKVRKSKVKELNKFIDHQFDFKSRSYFLECFEDNEP